MYKGDLVKEVSVLLDHDLEFGVTTGLREGQNNHELSEFSVELKDDVWIVVDSESHQLIPLDEEV